LLYQSLDVKRVIEEGRLAEVYEYRVLRKYLGLGGKIYQESGEDYVMRSFMLCTPQQILLFG